MTLKLLLDRNDFIENLDELFSISPRFKLAREWKVESYDRQRYSDSIIIRLKGYNLYFTDDDFANATAVYKCELRMYTNGEIKINTWVVKVIA